MEKLLVSVVLEQNDEVAGRGSPQGGLHYPRHAEAVFDFSQPFISLFINILHIKICVGSQKRAASTQYSTQWRGLGISGSVLWDLDWGGVLSLHFALKVLLISFCVASLKYDLCPILICGLS